MTDPISITRGGKVYTHPGWTPREFYPVSLALAEALDAPLLRLIPVLIADYAKIAKAADNAMEAGIGVVAAHKDAVGEALKDRPIRSVLADLQRPAVLDLVDEVLNRVTVTADGEPDSKPAGNTHTWADRADPWGPHIVAGMVLWAAQGFPLPAGS